jgi:hypothetical protein
MPPTTNTSAEPRGAEAAFNDDASNHQRAAIGDDVPHACTQQRCGKNAPPFALLKDLIDQRAKGGQRAIGLRPPWLETEDLFTRINQDE